MKMSTTRDNDVFAYGRDRTFTSDEYDALYDELDAAERRNDEAEIDRIIRLIPMNADVLKSFAKVYGKDFIISSGFDMTEADMKFGKGWLDELKTQ